MESAALAFTRQLADRLAENNLVVISGDGQGGQRHIERAFLGRVRRFAVGGISLARLTGAPILPLFCYERADGNIESVVEPPLEIPEGPLAADAAMGAFAQQLERWICLYPGQYRNWHSLY